jgi:isoquinoline 1-oxidoreductase beta subunit
MNLTLNRRHFLKSLGAVGGGLAIGIEFAGPADAAEAGAPLQAGPWIRIASNGTITVVVDKSEMGQGVLTSLPMLVAEELDADWDHVAVEQAPAAPQYAHPWFKVQATGGSTSVRAMWQPLREAGATARALLIHAAALTWKVDAASLHTEAGFVVGPKGRLSYGDLAGLAATLPLPTGVKLKDPGQFRLIGKSLPRTEGASKVNGSARFGIDVRVPGMLFASVERAPMIGGRVKTIDAVAALKLPGVREVRQIRSPTAEGVAVLADSSWAAKQGRAALKIDWTPGPQGLLATPALKAQMAALAKSREGARVAKRSGTPEAINEGTLVQATYEVPYLAHATMEPMNATAWVHGEGVEIWAPTQAQGPTQHIAANIAGCKPEQVQVTTTLLGGAFGRRFAPDFIIEAVQLSKLAKAPVQVLYSREDDMRAQYYRPAAHVELEARLAGDGQPKMVRGVTVVDSIAAGSGFEGALITPEGVDNTSVEGLADFPYATPNFQLDWVMHNPGVRTWFWRSVGSTQNGFFTESFIDELAHAAGADPFAYRQKLLVDKPRHRAALELAAKESGWGTPLPAGRARGIAVCESFGSYVAEVAEISLQDGSVRVHKVTIAADVGIVVNPDMVRAQLEGAMIYGLSAALYGKITLAEGRVEQSNFGDYAALRLSETPQVSVHLVSSAEAPGGVGEPGTPPITPAVVNALFALTGKRIRSLPLSDATLS